MTFLAHSRININLFGFDISVYGLILGLAIVVAIFVAVWLGKKRGITFNDILTVAIYAIPLAIIGARLYYVIFFDHGYTFAEIWEIWNGGLAILGGVIGGTLGVALYCLIHKKNFLKLTDIIAPALILGQAIGRIGCYFGGCCYGIQTIDPALTWFPMSVQIDGAWHLSTFFYESIWCFLGFALMLFLFKKLNKTGALTSSYLIIYGIGRMIIETWRGDSLYLGIFKVSQLLSGIMIILGIIGFIIIYTIDKKKKAKVLDKNETDINT